MFSLNESLDISNVVDCKIQYTEWLQQHSDDVIVLDAACVNRVDAAGLQLLVSFHHSARMAGKNLQFQNVSETLEEGLKVLGLDRILTGAQQ